MLHRVKVLTTQSKVASSKGSRSPPRTCWSTSIPLWPAGAFRPAGTAQSGLDPEAGQHPRLEDDPGHEDAQGDEELHRLGSLHRLTGLLPTAGPPVLPPRLPAFLRVTEQDERGQDDARDRRQAGEVHDR